MLAEDEEREQLVQQKLNELRQKIADGRQATSHRIAFEISVYDPIRLEAVERLAHEEGWEMPNEEVDEALSADESEQVEQIRRKLRRCAEIIEQLLEK